MSTSTPLRLLLLAAAATAQLNATAPLWQQQVFVTPLQARSGASGLVVNRSTLAFIGGVPAAAALTDVCLAASGAAVPALQTTLALLPTAPLGSSTLQTAPEAALAVPLTLATAASAPLPGSALGRLVTFSAASSDVLLWEGGAAAPVVCAAPPAPRPLPRAAAGLVWLANCNASSAAPSAPRSPCFALYGGTSASGAVAGDLWLLFGAEAALSAPPFCTWLQVPPGALAGDALPPLTQFAAAATAAHSEALFYGGLGEGGVASASVFRLAPLGYADADPDTEMVNLALPNPAAGLVPFAWQSSLPPASGGTANWGGFPSRAIDNARYPDGNIKTGYWDGSCTHTAPNDDNPWWGVDLGAPQAIHALRIYQRTDCCIGRFAGMAVYTSLTNNTNPARGGGNPWGADGVPFPLTNPNLLTASVLFPAPAAAPNATVARYVWVSLPGNNRYVTLCEVQVLQRKTMVVRNLLAPRNVALNKPTLGPFTNVGNSGGGGLLANAVDGVNTGAASVRNGNSFVRVEGPTGVGASAAVGATPHLVIDLQGTFSLSSLLVYPAAQPAANTRVSLYAGATQDFNYMQRCWGPGTLNALSGGGALGSGGFLAAASCAGASARYVAIARQLIDSPPPADGNRLFVNEIQVLASAQGVIPAMARYGAASARWGGFLFVFGGIDGGSGAVLGDLQLFDLGAMAWTSAPPVPLLGSPPPPRSGGALVALPPLAPGAPSSGLALFGGAGLTGDTGDLTLLAFPRCPPLNLFGALGAKCDETGTVCVVTCLPTWTPANPGSGNTFTCGLDGTWGLAVLPPCSGVRAPAPVVGGAGNGVVALGAGAGDASGRAAVNATWQTPAVWQYVPEWRPYQDNPGGDFGPATLPIPSTFTGTVPAFPSLGRDLNDFPLCWAKCNQTVGCIAWAYRNVGSCRGAPVGYSDGYNPPKPGIPSGCDASCPGSGPGQSLCTGFHCWLKAVVRPWTSLQERTSGSLPNPVQGYRVTAVPAGLTDFFNAATVVPLGAPNFTAGASLPASQNVNALYHIAGLQRCGGSVTPTAAGTLVLDQAQVCTCSLFPAVSTNCLSVARAWPEAVVPSNQPWAVETYVATPSGQINSLQSAQHSVGLALFSTAAGGGAVPLLFAGLSGGGTPALRSIDFRPTPYTTPMPPGAVPRSAPWSALGAFLRLESGSVAGVFSLRLGYRAATSDVWSFHPWQAAASLGPAPGGSPLGLPTLRVGFVVSNAFPVTDNRITMSVSSLRFVALRAGDKSRGCPAIGPAVTTATTGLPPALNWRVGATLPGLQPGVQFSLSVQAVTAAGAGLPGYLALVTTPPPPPPPALALVDAQARLALRLATSSAPLAPAALAVDGDPATAYRSSGTGAGAGATFPGELLTVDLGQPVTVYNLSLTAAALAQFQVLLHSSPSDYVRGLDTGLWAPLAGGPPGTASLSLFPPRTARYVTVRNGAATTAIAGPGDGRMVLNELRIGAGDYCPPFVGTLAVVAGGNGCGGGPLGVNCTLACAPGDLTPISGAAFAVCTGDAWSAPPLGCAPRCAPLPVPANLASCAATIFSDAFSATAPDGSGTVLLTPPATPLGTWLALGTTGEASGWGGAWSLQGGALHLNTLACASGHVLVMPAASLAAAASGSFSLLVTASTASAAGLVWGARDALNYYRAYLAMGGGAGSGALVIERVVAGAVSVLASASAPALNPGVPYALNLTVRSGVAFRLSVNAGLLSLASNDASPALAPSASAPYYFGVYGAQDAVYDDFAVVTSCFEGGVAAAATKRIAPGTSLALQCAAGFAPPFAPFTYSCTQNGTSAALTPATPPSCQLAPPVFNAQVLYVAEGSPRGTAVGPDPLKASSLSPAYSVDWTLNSGAIQPPALRGAFTLSPCSGQVELLQDGAVGPAARPHANVTISVTASIAGFPDSNVTRAVPVIVVPQDQPPTLFPTPFSLPENSLGGTPIGAPAWFDWDVNWTVPAWYTYSWSWSDASGGLLVIDERTGFISVAPGVAPGQLNYETLLPTRTYGQITRMTEVNATTYTSSAVMTIALLDMNDPPTIAPAGQALTLTDARALPGGTAFPLLQYADEDTGVWAGASALALVSPADVLALNATPPAYFLPAQLAQVAACAAATLLPTANGLPGGAPLFGLDASGNLTVLATPPPTACAPGACLPPAAPGAWTTYGAFQDPSGALVRGHFQVCANASDPFGGWGVGLADVWITVSSAGLASIPVITSWSCSGPGILDPATMAPLDPPGQGGLLPTAGGTPTVDVCRIEGTGFAASFSLGLTPSPGSPSAGQLVPAVLDMTPSCAFATSTLITCTPPPGAGTGLALLMYIAPGPAQQQAFDQSLVTFTYAPPVVTLLTVDGGATLSTLPVAGGVTLTLTGANFGPPGTRVSLAFGLSLASVCAPLPALSSQTSFSCVIPPGTGAGLPWALSVAGQTIVAGASQFLSYAPAVLTALRIAGANATGVYDVPLASNAVLNVTTDGSQTVYLLGASLGPAPLFSVGGGGASSPAPLTPVNCTSPADGSTSPSCPCPAAAPFCWSFAAPPGAGPPLGLQVYAGNQLASPSPLIWAYAPPRVDSLLRTAPPASPDDPVFPTQGGVALTLRGANFGPLSATTGAGALATAVLFAPPGTPPAATALWTPCLDIVPGGDYAIACVLPEGSGFNWDVQVSVGGVVGVSPGKLSYDAPKVLSAFSSGGATQVPYPGAGGNASGSVEVLRGGTVGGDVITLTGLNFGRNNASALALGAGGGGGVVTNLRAFATAGGGSALQFSNCVFLTWAQRPPQPAAAPRLHTCNGGDDWLGEGEVPSSSILSWDHTRISFTVPPGLGQKEIQLVIGGAAVIPPRVSNASDPAAIFAGAGVTALSSPRDTLRFWYADPVVTSLRACPLYDATCAKPLPLPALAGTDGCAPGTPADGVSCTLLRLDGANFGPPPMAIEPSPAGLALAYTPSSAVLAALQSDVFTPPLPLSLTPYVPTSFTVVQLHRSCVVFGLNFLGNALPVGLTVDMPLGVGATPLAASATSGCLQAIVSQSHGTVLLQSPPGVGVNRSASVIVVSDSSAAGQQAAAPAAPTPLTFSYSPPLITGFNPSVVALGSDVTASAIVNIFGRNFGNDEFADAQAWTADERAVSGSLLNASGAPLPFAGNCTRSRTRDTAGSLVTMLSCGVNPATASAGYANVVVQVAGQRADSTGSPAAEQLLFACLQGYYARMGEVCLPCPAWNPNPALVGAECTTPHAPGRQSPDQLNFLAPPPPCCDNTCATTLDPVTGARVPTPLCAVNNLTDAEFPLRFLYPRPLPGWYDLNASDFLSTGMRASCPGDIAVQTAPRDVCIVPCSPASACLGDNRCALGYVSKAPGFRCASCAAGYFASAGTCARCPDSPAAVFVVFALVVVGVAGTGYWLNKQQVNIAMVSIGVDFFQVLAIFASSGVVWPPAVRQLLAIMSAFNLNIEIVAPECLVPNVTWTQKFLAIMALPLVVGAMLGAAFLSQVAAKCARGIRERKKLYSHTPAMVSSSLVLLYLLYLYLTRTALDVFNCAPTLPEDGRTYLQVVFEDCALPGGIRQTMWPVAVLALLGYTFGYPAYLGHVLWQHRYLAMEDQLLRAKGVGNDALTNPHALAFRQMFGRSYYQFKPEWGLWVLAILARKLCIAFSAIMFNRSVNFQMAACLLIVFLAYAAQVQVRPYMSPSEHGAVLEAHEAAALRGDPLHARLKSAIQGIDSMGRKQGVRRELFKAEGTLDPSALFKALRDYAFNFNTVEATMLFCIVIVCLMAVMYNANVGSSYYPQATDSITSVTLLTMVFGIVYFLTALGVEVAAMESCQRRRRGGDSGGSKLLRSQQTVIPRGPVDESFNPMFLTTDGQLSALGSTDSLVQSILSQKDAPAKELWSVFRAEFSKTVEALKSTQGALAEMKRETQARALGGEGEAGGAGGGGGGSGGGFAGGASASLRGDAPRAQVRRYEASPLAAATSLAFARRGSGSAMAGLRRSVGGAPGAGASSSSEAAIEMVPTAGASV